MATQSVPPPLLLIDVDGVISLFGFGAGRRPPGQLVMVDGLPHLLADHTGDRLTRLSRSFECVWCTGWEERAGEHLPHLLGLVGAPYPHLTFDGFDGQPGRHWKLDAIDAHAGTDRALAWVDDGHDARTRAWADGRPGPTLLVTTDPAVAPYLCWAGEVKAGGALAWLLVRVGCARTPSLISVLDLGLPGVGDMMVDGGFRDAVRPLDL